MTVRQLVVTESGRLRAPWRVLLFLVLCGVGSALAWAFVGAPLSWAFQRLGLGPVRVDQLVTVVGFVAATAVMLRVDRRGWDYVSLHAVAGRPRVLGGGLLLGALAIGAPVGVLVVTGLLVRQSAPGSDVLAAAARVTIILLPAALAEELLTRGYLFSVLREAWGARATVVVTSAVFALLHLANAGATVTSLAYVALAGVFLGGVLVATRSLYAAWMAHFAWNWTMAVLFHVTVSGWSLEAPAYRYVDAGPDWLTGGVWGPEASVPAALGMIGGLTFLYARRRRREET